MRHRLSVRFAVAIVSAFLGVAGAGAAVANAAPTNAPSSLTGSFFGCSNGDSGTFVVNSGNNHATQTWNVAHLTFSTGGTGIFVPTNLALTFNGMSAPPSTKGSAPGSVTCSISAGGNGFTLTGSVTGNIITTG